MRGALLCVCFTDTIADSQLTDVLKRLAAAAKAGADAFAISDLGLYRALRRLIPNVPVYAACELNIHGLEGVLNSEELGFNAAWLNASVTEREITNILRHSANPLILRGGERFIRRLASEDKLIIEANVYDPHDSESVAAIAEHYSDSISRKHNIRADEIEALKDGLSHAAIRAGLISQERREFTNRAKPRYKGGEYVPPNLRPSEPKGFPKINIKFSHIEQLSDDMANLFPQVIYMPVDEILKAPERFTRFWTDGITEICAEFPEFISDVELPGFRDKLEKVKALQIESALLSNIGHVTLAKNSGFTIKANFPLTVQNSQALQLLKRLEFETAAVSDSLSAEEMSGLYKYIPVEAKHTEELQRQKLGLWALRVEFYEEVQRECFGRLQRILS
jgi:hypothetical protein